MKAKHMTIYRTTDYAKLKTKMKNTNQTKQCDVLKKTRRNRFTWSIRLLKINLIRFLCYTAN